MCGFSPLSRLLKAGHSWVFQEVSDSPAVIPITSSGLVRNVEDGWKMGRAFTDLSPRDSLSGRGWEERDKKASLFVFNVD